MSNRKRTFLRPLNEVFVTSDNHFFHRFMAAHRGFDSVEAHNETLVENWNKMVPEGSLVLLLGDFSFGNVVDTQAILDRLSGEKFIIPGNHDDSKRLTKWFGDDNVLPQLLTIKVVEPHDPLNKMITFEASHYPLASWNGSDHGRLHLHGHLHSKNNSISHHFCSPYEGAGVRYDIGIDNAEWFGVPLSPIPLVTVRNRYAEDSQAKAMPE